MLVQLQHLMIFVHIINFVELLQSPFFRLLIDLLVSVPIIIKTVKVLSALGEGKGLPISWNSLIFDLVFILMLFLLMLASVSNTNTTVIITIILLTTIIVITIIIITIIIIIIIMVAM